MRNQIIIVFAARNASDSKLRYIQAMEQNLTSLYHQRSSTCPQSISFWLYPGQVVDSLFRHKFLSGAKSCCCFVSQHRIIMLWLAWQSLEKTSKPPLHPPSPSPHFLPRQNEKDHLSWPQVHNIARQANAIELVVDLICCSCGPVVFHLYTLIESYTIFVYMILAALLVGCSQEHGFIGILMILHEAIWKQTPQRHGHLCSCLAIHFHPCIMQRISWGKGAR